MAHGMFVKKGPGRAKMHDWVRDTLLTLTLTLALTLAPSLLTLPTQSQAQSQTQTQTPPSPSGGGAAGSHPAADQRVCGLQGLPWRQAAALRPWAVQLELDGRRLVE